MLERLVRKLFLQIGFEDISTEDITRFIAFSKLDKLDAKYTFALITIFPVLELILKKVKAEHIDFSELVE
jgi:hypothetical protein